MSRKSEQRRKLELQYGDPLMLLHQMDNEAWARAYEAALAGESAALEKAGEEAEKHAAFLAWLDAEIEAARQLLRSDPIATRSALERVKARLVG